MQFGTLRVYVINAKLSALNFTSVKLAKLAKLAKLSSQTLRGVRLICEALDSNKKFHSVQSETLRVHVINAKFSALNFTSMKFVVAELRLKRCEVYANSAKLSTRMSPNFVVAKLSSQTLRGLRQVFEALNFNAKSHLYLVIHNVYDAL